jgi:hypothetical protein
MAVIRINANNATSNATPRSDFFFEGFSICSILQFRNGREGGHDALPGLQIFL